MSGAFLVPTGNYDTVWTNLTNTAATTILTVTNVPNYTVVFIAVTDGSGAARTATITHTRNSIEYPVAVNGAVATASALEISRPIVMKRDETLKLTGVSGMAAMVTYYSVSRSVPSGGAPPA